MIDDDSPETTRRPFYQRAGELYGEIKARIGFGDLGMRQDNQGVFIYEWSIAMRNRRYVAQWAVSPLALDSVYSIKHMATQIVANWKEDYESAKSET